MSKSTTKLMPTVRFLFVKDSGKEAVVTCMYGDDEGFSYVLHDYFSQGYTGALMHWRGHYYHCEPKKGGGWIRHQADDSHPWIPILEKSLDVKVS